MVAMAAKESLCEWYVCAHVFEREKEKKEIKEFSNITNNCCIDNKPLMKHL